MRPYLKHIYDESYTTRTEKWDLLAFRHLEHQAQAHIHEIRVGLSQ